MNRSTKEANNKVVETKCDEFLQTIPFLYYHDIRKWHEIQGSTTILNSEAFIISQPFKLEPS